MPTGVNGPAGTTRWHAEYAWLPDADHDHGGGAGRFAADVLIEVTDGRFVTVTPGVPAGTAPDTVRLPGLTLPGLANTHSHAFHRALRGRTHGGAGTFWSWRQTMYAVADRLTPDSYLALARATYAEMALAGVTCVGEFHYLHHDRGGIPYDDPNVMGAALVEAAGQAGIRLTLLDTAYFASSVDGAAPVGPQRRFADRDAADWAERVDAFTPTGHHARAGAAIHSVRAVPAAQLPEIVASATTREVPLHVHLSEQVAENQACLATHGRTPTALLADHGALGPRTTAVHATHLTDADLTALGGTRTGVCLCPTTERELADGIGPARALADAGSPLSLGSDSHAIIDLFEEARAVELHERLRTRRRGHFVSGELLTAATAAGHTALGWGDAGTIAAGNRADLVTVRLDGVRTAAVPPEGVLFAATAADDSHVLVDGRVVVRDGRHVTIDVAAELRSSVEEVTRP
jgi:formiminoglutamate deiminase